MQWGLSMTATPLQELLSVDAALSAELEQRWAKHQQHPQEAVSWDVVRQDLG